MYRQLAVSALADIPPLVKTFAADLGWAVSGVCTIERPGGGTPFSMSAGSYSAGGGVVAPRGQHRYLDVGNDTVYRLKPRVFAPRLLGDYNQGWEPGNPTLLHLIGGVEAGSAYIVVVVEFGFNDYRHIYIGNMVKIGDYAGGEVLSATNNNVRPRNDNEYPFNGYYRSEIRALFSNTTSGNANVYPDDFNDAFNTADLNLRSGAVKIEHADNPNTWRYFSNIRTSGALQGREIGGGYTDGIHDYEVAKAFAPFAGSAVLVTPTLWCSHAPVGNVFDNRFIPVGHPAGVRMVNMRDLTPGQEIEVGTEKWRVFPEFSKRESFTVPRVGTAYPPFETSRNNGYAYRV